MPRQKVCKRCGTPYFLKHLCEKRSVADVKAAEALAKLRGTMFDPTTSWWLRDAISAALERDPVASAAEAEVLAGLLRAYAMALLESGKRAA